MNFKNADIRAFIEFVSSFSNKNFLVDNRVKGSVTIVSPTPISESEAYDVFLSVLEVNGFAAVNSGSVIKIVPRAEGKQKAVTVRASGKAPNNDEVMTQVLRLKYADAQQLVALLRPLISPNSHLVAYPRGNMLLLTDSASNIRRIQNVLQLVDRQDAVGVQMFPLEHASADKLAKTLTGLYAKAGPNSPTSIKALAHQPGNILIVVAAPQMINEVAAIVKKLDIQPKPDSGRLQVRYLKHGNATDVAKVLTELVGGTTSSKPGVVGKTLFTGDVKIVADPATNALLITADPSDMNAMNGIIDKLDVRRRQVLVEALIVEVSAGVGEQFGIEWRSANGFGGSSASTFGGTAFTNTAGESINTIAANPLAAGAGLAVGVAKGTLSFGSNSIVNLGGLVRALSTQTDANILSTPNILTMDNEEAEIVVGQNVPFITGSSSTQGGVTNPFQTVERKDVGITLRVKPQISEGNTVRLEIYQEISNVNGGTAAEGGLITSKRSIKTVVLANDGGMIILGGLMRDENTAGVQRVPCLGSIPILGEAFKFTENKKSKTNLMVFLRPHIVKDENDIRTLTNRKYNDIQELYEEPIKGGTILFPHESNQMPKYFSKDGSLTLEESIPESPKAK
ncbi:MAG: type II secretion system secretin GspD [Ghiorsea sp.]